MKNKLNMKDIDLIKRKILTSPEPGPSCHVPFSEISPMPHKTKKEGKGKGQGKRTKQHSTILTSTPMKTVLENKLLKRTIKKEKEEEIKKKLKTCKKKTRVSKRPTKKPTKKRTYSTSSSDANENVLCDDDDENDEPFYDEGQQGIDELCVICGEFGKNRELWFRCVSCGKWAHALCSGENSADNYVCAFCE